MTHCKITQSHNFHSVFAPFLMYFSSIWAVLYAFMTYIASTLILELITVIATAIQTDYLGEKRRKNASVAKNRVTKFSSYALAIVFIGWISLRDASPLPTYVH